MFFAEGRINDGIEKGKACIIVGESEESIRKAAEQREVYELYDIHEISEPLAITYMAPTPEHPGPSGLRYWIC